MQIDSTPLPMSKFSKNIINDFKSTNFQWQQFKMPKRYF